MEFFKELFYQFLRWHEVSFFLNQETETAYTMGQFISFFVAFSYISVMVFNIRHSHTVHRSYVITSIIIASSYVFSTIGYLVIHELLLAATSAEVLGLKLHFSWVAFDSVCVFFIVWLHIGSSTQIIQHTKIVMYLLLLNSLSDVGVEMITSSEMMWVFIGDEPLYPWGRYRPSLIVVSYTYLVIIINILMFYYLGGKFLVKKYLRKPW